ncbi:XdhC family protein [uncultured Nostoc sp.]|uniref:XdhC family protein n=1 Tax=uncultured Nostoc sp. TaxID=340711 RepID=UPI0035CAD398
MNIQIISDRLRISYTYNFGGYTLEFLHKIYAPIGLDIGALAPQEIAVSICAELIKVRCGGSGASLSGKI